MRNLIKTLISYWIYWCDTLITINVLPLLWSLQSAHIVCALLFREIIQHSIVIFKSLPTHNLGSQKKNDKNIELHKKHIISTYILGSRILKLNVCSTKNYCIITSLSKVYIFSKVINGMFSQFFRRLVHIVY